MAGWHHWRDGREFWVNSGSWWWTGKPGVLQSTGSQRVGHDWATELTDWLMTVCDRSLSVSQISSLFCDKSQSSLGVRLSPGEGAYDSWVPFGCLQVKESSALISPCIWCFSDCIRLKIISTPEWNFLGGISWAPAVTFSTTFHVQYKTFVCFFFLFLTHMGHLRAPLGQFTG